MISKTHTKYIQSLQHKKFRDEFAVFIAEGPKVVLDLLTSRKFICTSVFAEQQWLDENALLPEKYPATAFESIKDFELEKISALTTPNSVLAVFEKAAQHDPADLGGKITLSLDTIQDPGNMGTIIRIADWFGIENIICSTGCADMYNPKVVQSTMGSLARVNIFYTNLASWLQNKRTVNIYAAALNGKNIKTISPVREGIIVIGNEGRGISDEIMELADERISIPKTGGGESLNAAVATGIILSQLT
jgi:TrmH family RNA methyltransferase